MKFKSCVFVGLLLVLILLEVESIQAAPTFQQIGGTLIMSNVNVRLEYNLNAGTTDFSGKIQRRFPLSTAVSV